MGRRRGALHSWQTCGVLLPYLGRARDFSLFGHSGRISISVSVGVSNTIHVHVAMGGAPDTEFDFNSGRQHGGPV
eukprot:14954887-Heterocapsa_arctica.AAC.1